MLIILGFKIVYSVFSDIYCINIVSLIYRVGEKYVIKLLRK